MTLGVEYLAERQSIDSESLTESFDFSVSIVVMSLLSPTLVLWIVVRSVCCGLSFSSLKLSMLSSGV